MPSLKRSYSHLRSICSDSGPGRFSLSSSTESQCAPSPRLPHNGTILLYFLPSNVHSETGKPLLNLSHHPTTLYISWPSFTLPSPKLLKRYSCSDIEILLSRFNTSNLRPLGFGTVSSLVISLVISLVSLPILSSWFSFFFLLKLLAFSIFEIWTRFSAVRSLFEASRSLVSRSFRELAVRNVVL